MEGSVRKAGNRARVTAQLIGAGDSASLWADRYDCELEDIFDAQDEVVRAIVAVLPGRIAEAGAESSRRKPTTDLTAFDYLLRGNEALARGGDKLDRAGEYFRQAIERDPECAAAYAGASMVESQAIWDLSRYDDDPAERAYEYGKRAIEFDTNDYRCHAAFGESLRNLGRHDLARHHLERAMALNPNSAYALTCWGMLLAYTGDPEGAVDTYHAAVRLDPLGQDKVRKEILAEAYYNMHEYEKALGVLESMLELPIFYVHQQMAMCHAQLGNQQACARSLQLYRAELPTSYDERLLFESHLRLCAREEDREHWTEGYRLIGMDV